MEEADAEGWTKQECGRQFFPLSRLHGASQLVDVAFARSLKSTQRRTADSHFVDLGVDSVEADGSMDFDSSSAAWRHMCSSCVGAAVKELKDPRGDFARATNFLASMKFRAALFVPEDAFLYCCRAYESASARDPNCSLCVH